MTRKSELLLNQSINWTWLLSTCLQQMKKATAAVYLSCEAAYDGAEHALFHGIKSPITVHNINRQYRRQ